MRSSGSSAAAIARPSGAAGGADHDVLRQHRADKAPTTGAERLPDGEFLASGQDAGDAQAGDVHRGDEEEKGAGGEEKPTVQRDEAVTTCVDGRTER